MSIEQRLREIRRESSSDAAGDPERFRRVALTETEMMSQGDAIRATLEANAAPLAQIAADLADRPIRRIAMVGCGDSWISGHGVRHVVERLTGAVCEPCEAFDFATYGLDVVDAETVVIGLSSSGKTEPVIEGLKGAAARGGRGVFQGKIHVERAAQKTDAKMNHRGLLLDGRSEIDAKPELEIYADDVVCAHGNALGAMDAAALFYMRQRGLSEAGARALLTQSFLAEPLERLSDETVRDALMARLQTALEGVS